jgi:hypothetical protein
VNPPATFPSSGGFAMSKTVSSSSVFNSLGLAISSTDTGGPTTRMAIDEIRLGYTWNDVVPQGPATPLVPDLQITNAVKLKWQSVAGKTYQVQASYDLSAWSNFGSSIQGDGAIKSVFDSADSDAKRFYRVQINN